MRPGDGLHLWGVWLWITRMNSELRLKWREAKKAQYANLPKARRRLLHAKSKKWMRDNPQAAKKYHLRDYEVLKRRLAENPTFAEERKARRKAYRTKVSLDPVKHAKLLENHRRSYRANKKPASDARIAWVRAYQNKRRATDPQFRIRTILSGQINAAIRGHAKASRSEILLGCSWSEFITRIERQWLPGMSWSNYGRGVGRWSLDHRKPCAVFDLRNPTEQRICFHFSNLRPLWHYDNQSKGSLWEGVRHRQVTKEKVCQ